MSASVAVAKKKAEKPATEDVEPKYNTLTRLADDVVEKARILAPMLGVTMAEMLSDMVRPILEKALEEEGKRRFGRK